MEHTAMKEHTEPLLHSHHSTESRHSTDSEYGLPEPNDTSKWHHTRSLGLLCASVLWFSGSLILLFSAIIAYNRPAPRVSPNLVYSPAQDVVRYKEVVFPPFGSHSPYQGDPSPEVDKAWTDLYNIGISWITASEAAQLPNKTSAIPGTERYIVGLDVFHQLHCLNMLRQMLRPQYYTEYLLSNENRTKHESHCIEHLRLAVMCNADISTVYWQWNSEMNMTQADARVTHTCRDFGAVQDWGVERQVIGDFDKSVYVEGNPVFEEGD